MPKLAALAIDNADLAERFLVVGVHQKGPASLEAVRRSALARFAAYDGPDQGRLLPVNVLDADSGGLFHGFAPKLGDMVLLDPKGTVVAVGASAFEKVRRDLQAIRRQVSELAARLEQAKVGRDAAEAIGELLDLGLTMADDTARRYAARCPTPVAASMLEALGRRGHTDVVLTAMRDSDPKRRKAAFEAMAAAPAAAFIDPLLAFTAQKKVPADEVCLALRAACAFTPPLPAVEARVTELSRKADPPVRSCALELLGKLGTPSARQHLLDVLAKDEWRGARIAAAVALGKLGGDDAVQALERAVAEDKIDTVRAAAKQALAALSKQSAPK